MYRIKQNLMKAIHRNLVLTAAFVNIIVVGKKFIVMAHFHQRRRIRIRIPGMAIRP